MRFASWIAFECRLPHKRGVMVTLMSSKTSGSCDGAESMLSGSLPSVVTLAGRLVSLSKGQPWRRE
jgi:hypothetical protein